MSALRRLGAELLGLFIEDRYFALAVAVWLAIIGIAAAARGHSLLFGVALFAGLALILVASVVTSARKSS